MSVKDICGRDDLFSALHLNLSGKLDIGGRAALGFKIFANVALRVNIIAHPCCNLLVTSFLHRS